MKTYKPTIYRRALDRKWILLFRDTKGSPVKRYFDSWHMAVAVLRGEYFAANVSL